jgi:hypothetical protein
MVPSLELGTTPARTGVLIDNATATFSSVSDPPEESTGAADALAAPEPGTLALVALGALLVAMVRRLKDEFREAVPGLKLPKREVVQHDISGLPNDARDLALRRLLTQYRALAGEAPRRQPSLAADRRQPSDYDSPEASVLVH